MDKIKLFLTVFPLPVQHGKIQPQSLFVKFDKILSITCTGKDLMTKQKSKKDAPGSKRLPIYLNDRQARILVEIVEKGEWKSSYAYAKSVIVRHMKLMQRVFKGEMVPDPLGIVLKADYGITPQAPVIIEKPTTPTETVSETDTTPSITNAPVSEEALAHGKWMTSYLKAQKEALLERESLLNHMSEVRSALKKELSPVGTFKDHPEAEKPQEPSPMKMKDELKSLFSKKKKEVAPLE